MNELGRVLLSRLFRDYYVSGRQIVYRTDTFFSFLSKLLCVVPVIWVIGLLIDLSESRYRHQRGTSVFLGLSLLALIVLLVFARLFVATYKVTDDGEHLLFQQCWLFVKKMAIPKKDIRKVELTVILSRAADSDGSIKSSTYAVIELTIVSVNADFRFREWGSPFGFSEARASRLGCDICQLSGIPGQFTVTDTRFPSYAQRKSVTVQPLACKRRGCPRCRSGYLL